MYIQYVNNLTQLITIYNLRERTNGNVFSWQLICRYAIFYTLYKRRWQLQRETANNRKFIKQNSETNSKQELGYYFQARNMSYSDNFIILPKKKDAHKSSKSGSCSCVFFGVFVPWLFSYQRYQLHEYIQHCSLPIHEFMNWETSMLSYVPFTLFQTNHRVV